MCLLGLLHALGSSLGGISCSGPVAILPPPHDKYRQTFEDVSNKFFPRTAVTVVEITAREGITEKGDEITEKEDEN